ncbi:MAG TPA: hypothetical protein VN886_05520 [Acidimicrobiales bacterium]|nr:hypothetical protein [Acidimicrobiales bacterium]
MTTHTTTEQTLQAARTALGEKQAEITEAERRAAIATTPDDLIRAEAEATIARRALPELEQNVLDAEAAHRADQRKQVAKQVAESMPPYDRAIIDTLDVAKVALEDLAKASESRERAVALSLDLAREAGEEHGLITLKYAPVAGKYRLTSTRAEVVTELAAILADTFRSLKEDGLAEACELRRYGGTRLTNGRTEKKAEAA